MHQIVQANRMHWIYFVNYYFMLDNLIRRSEAIPFLNCFSIHQAACCSWRIFWHKQIL